MSLPSTFDTRDEAIQRLIIEPIENSGVVKDARAAYDVDGIADKVIGAFQRFDQWGYGQMVSPERFWEIVADHEYTDGGI